MSEEPSAKPGFVAKFAHFERKTRTRDEGVSEEDTSRSDERFAAEVCKLQQKEGFAEGSEETNQEFYVFCHQDGVVEIKEVLTGNAIGVTSEKPGKTRAILKNVKNQPPEGIYTGTLSKLKLYIETQQPPEKQTVKIIWEKTRKKLQKLFSRAASVP